jgi:hypothetical protein
MSRISMSPRDVRALVLLIVAAVAAFAWRPLSAAYTELRDGIASNRQALAIELDLLENATRYPDLYATADSNLRSVMPRLFLEQDDVLATVALQQFVDNVARNSSVLITHARNQPATRLRNGIRELQIEIQAESDLEGILKFLDRLEAGMRVIQVRSLDLRPGNSESGIPSNENAIKIVATLTGFGIDTAVVRGHVPPPTTASRARKSG